MNLYFTDLRAGDVVSFKNYKGYTDFVAYIIDGYKGDYTNHHMNCMAYDVRDFEQQQHIQLERTLVDSSLCSLIFRMSDLNVAMINYILIHSKELKTVIEDHYKGTEEYALQYTLSRLEDPSLTKAEAIDLCYRLMKRSPKEV